MLHLLVTTSAAPHLLETSLMLQSQESQTLQLGSQQAQTGSKTGLRVSLQYRNYLKALAVSATGLCFVVLYSLPVLL